MNAEGAREYIFARLEKELPPNLYYHGLHHTVEVCETVRALGSSERIDPEDLTLVLTAAAFHDAGFIKEYHNNEPIGADLVAHVLPNFHFTHNQIKSVQAIILSTRIPQKPNGLLESIMCDADLDYLGRDDYFEVAQTLKMEWFAFGIIQSDEEWNRAQIQFLENHRYFTATATSLREEKKQANLRELKKLA